MARPDGPRDLRLRRAVPRAERREALAEVELVAAEAADVRPPVAAQPPILWKRRDDDEFPLDMIRFSRKSPCLSPYAASLGVRVTV